LTSRQKLVLLHSSDELYGADRMLLEMVGAVTDTVEVEVWLPNDLTHPRDALCHELIRRNIRVRHLRLPIIRRANRNPRGLIALLERSVALRRELRDARPLGVYCTTSPTFLCAPVARLAGVPRVIGHSQEVWSRSDRYVLTCPALACHTLLAISSAVAESMPPLLRKQAVVVPNGTPEPQRVVSLDGRSGELQFLVASRWNGWKGHRTLLTAWDRAGAPGRLVVLGGEPPSGESVDVPALVSALAQPGSVSVIGEVPDPSSYLEQADVVIMPSDRPEPFGLVAIEAFARARPVIASAGGGLLDIVTPGVDGWLFPPGDSEALAAVLSSLTREQVAAAGERARQTYETRFSARRFAEDWRRTVLDSWLRP
jgi:glycosyltransferase involved in cell wall biosynthesis